MSTHWTAENDDLIRAGLAQGLSRSEIAATLCAAGRPSTTRCAVSGRVKRLEDGPDCDRLIRFAIPRGLGSVPHSRPRAKRLARVANDTEAFVGCAPVQKAKSAAEHKSATAEILAGFTAFRALAAHKRAEALAAGHVRLMDISARQCRRPVGGSGLDTLACSAPAPAGASFCAACSRLMYRQVLRPVYVARGLDSMPAVEVKDDGDLVDLLGEVV